jgi:stearoyl-CoA desaturase (delta-9 desaturase)
MNSDWDPTKWIIYLLHKYTPLVPYLARTPESAVTKARARMHMVEADRLFGTVKADEMVKNISDLPTWSRSEVLRRHGEMVRSGEGRRRRVLLLLEGCVVDVGGYLEDHVRSFSSLSP